MIWLVQNNTFNEENYDGFIAALRAQGQVFHQLNYILFEHTIDLKVDQHEPDDLLPIGSTSLAQYGMKNGWRVFFDPGFDYLSVAVGYGKHFLNSDYECNRISDVVFPVDGKVFIRQNEGFNLCKGRVISCWEWDAWRAGWLEKTDGYGTVTEDTVMVWAPVKKILAEYRVFVVNGKPVTSSQYWENGELALCNTDDSEEIMGFARRMCDYWRPGETFVLDLARTADGLFVNEINCLNCSGNYAINPDKLVRALAS